MEKPVSGFDDTGLPAWQEIRRLIDDEAPILSQHVRDELAGILLWARYGKKSSEEVAGKHSENCGCVYCA